MKAHRLARVAEVVREVASETILFELRDPRVKNVTVTRTEVSGDLQHAKVYVSVMGSEKEQNLTLHGLKHAAGFVQAKLASRLKTRFTPVIQFVLDKGVKHSIEITRAETRADGKGKYILTPGWRLLGTLNVSDKASLFQLSFAFLRRFAVVDVPLPSRDDYAAWFAAQCVEIPDAPRLEIVEAAMRLAFGRVELGPAILGDIARFVTVGLTETSTGIPTYDDAIHAFLTAVRLYAVPQYEGATTADTTDAIALLRGVWPDREDPAWAQLEEAMSFVAVA